MLMQHDVDPKEALFAEVGDISKLEILHNQVLVAVYRRPEKTAGGLILPESNRDEDNYQGKVGLIVKVGPDAFKDDTGKWSWGKTGVGSWVLIRPSDSWSVGVVGDDKTYRPGLKPALCRMMSDTSIRGTIQHPDMVW